VAVCPTGGEPFQGEVVPMDPQDAKRRYRVHTRYDSPYPSSIVFATGESVTIGEQFKDEPDWNDWIRCSGDSGKEAWVPLQFLDIDGHRGSLRRDYDAKELSVGPGDIVDVIEIVNGFARGRNKVGETGWVPLKCMEPCDD
jgi:hypothetical protein